MAIQEEPIYENSNKATMTSSQKQNEEEGQAFREGVPLPV